MSLTAYPITTFGGIDLTNDPEEVSPQVAIDLLNVDFDKPGRIHSRDGYDNLTTAAHTSRFKHITPYYTSTGTKQLIAATAVAGAFSSLIAYSTAGAIVAQYGAGFPDTFGIGVRFGTPALEYLYMPTTVTGVVVERWDGAAFTAIATMPNAQHFTVQAPDNRMVAGNYYGSVSKVGFSSAGDAETWGVNDFVIISPGDGEGITALASWRELVFAFKETKFAVFTGNSVSGTGTPVFNYRMVTTGLGTVSRVAVGRPGVFFINRRGVYLTNGSEPQLISRALDPLFLGTVTSPYSGSSINMAQITNAAMVWIGERLYVSVATGASTTNNRLLVWDSIRDQWTIWDIPAAGLASFRVGDNEDLVFSYASGSNHIGRQSSSFTNDDGTAISSFYQSGFYELSAGNKATTRWSKLWGSGSPTFDIYTNHATSDSLTRGAAVTLGTAPAVSSTTHNKSYTGELFSHRLSSTSGAWSVNRIQHDIAETSKP